MRQSNEKWDLQQLPIYEREVRNDADAHLLYPPLICHQQCDVPEMHHARFIH
jgi:hypothetical protein